MIEELRVTNRQQTPIGWWPDVKSFSRRKVFRFQPGMNILLGPNGTGKSTIIKALARLTHCEQGGCPRLTETSIRHFMKDRVRGGEDRPKTGLSLVSDGQPVHYFDPSVSPGLVGGSFDYDFLDEAITLSLPSRKVSSGQVTMGKLNRILRLARECGETVDIPTFHWNDIWMDAVEVAVRGLKSQIPKGQKTILLDEPGRSLDLLNQIQLWDLLRKITDGGQAQFIVATHAIQALEFEGAHIIETEKGYHGKVLQALEK